MVLRAWADAQVCMHTIQEHDSSALADSDGRLSSGCLSKPLHKAAIVEGSPSYIAWQIVSGIGNLCLPSIFEDAIAMHLQPSSWHQSLNNFICRLCVHTREQRDKSTATYLTTQTVLLSKTLPSTRSSSQGNNPLVSLCSCSLITM